MYLTLYGTTTSTFSLAGKFVCKLQVASKERFLCSLLSFGTLKCGFVYTEAEYDDEARTALAVALNYRRLGVVKVLIDAGANINKSIYCGLHAMKPLLALVLFEGRMELIKLLIGAGVDVTPSGWNGRVYGLDGWDGVIAFNLYWPMNGCVSDTFSTEFLVLWM